jgi:hypothetical protein
MLFGSEPTTVKLTPEQSRAYRVFQESVPHYGELVVPHITLNHITVQNSRVFVKEKIARKSLPHENHWVWNQSKPQQCVEYSKEYSVIMYKLNPRKNAACNAQHRCPAYKLWVFILRPVQANSASSTPMNFLWCEKGKDTANSPAPLVPLNTAIGRINPEEISLTELSFLKDFMDRDVATQFGWQ